MTTNGADNGKVTMAALKQEVKDYKENNNHKMDDLKADLKEVKISLSEIKGLLIQGEGKIRRNFMLINSHWVEHEKREGRILAISGIIATLMTVFISFFIYFFKL